MILFRIALIPGLMPSVLMLGNHGSFDFDENQGKGATASAG